MKLVSQTQRKQLFPKFTTLISLFKLIDDASVWQCTICFARYRKLIFKGALCQKKKYVFYALILSDDALNCVKKVNKKLRCM